MKKKILIIVLVIILLLILLVSVPHKFKDGGTVQYTAVLYTYTVYHILTENAANGYITGTALSIFGLKVFDTVFN